MSRKTGKRFQHDAGDWLGDDCSFSFGAVDDRTINESVTRPKYGSQEMASSSAASTMEEEQPMVDEATARSWLAEEGFAEGDRAVRLSSTNR